MPPLNPCLACGACCAYFRVSFYWLEADPGVENAVPADYTEDLPPYRLCMKGTNDRQPRCVALIGTVGAETSCSVYDRRPTPCREFGVQFASGRILSAREEIERCNHARAAWRLPPILLPDAPASSQGWVEVE